MDDAGAVPMDNDARVVARQTASLMELDVDPLTASGSRTCELPGRTG